MAEKARKVICLGYSASRKTSTIAKYCKAHHIKKVYIFSPQRFLFRLGGVCVEYIEWAEIIQYKCYYRLLQEINGKSLLVINECLRTQNRYDLTYNCLRLYLQQTSHQIIFQYLPIIETVDDFTVLFDFDTRSRWKREPFNASLLGECELDVVETSLSLKKVDVTVNDVIKKLYDKKKRSLIDDIGLKDPHTIPRNLQLMGGKSKIQAIDHTALYVGRNRRFKLSNFYTYREVSTPGSYTVFEFCHNFIDFSDFLFVSGQRSVPVLVADLPVDSWYFNRYQQWVDRINETYSILRG